MNRYIKTYCIASLVTLTFLFSCDEEENEPATITFYPTLAATGAEPDEGTPGSSLTVVLRSSRVIAEDSRVNIRIAGNGAGYGYSYTTYPPQLEPGIITLTIPRGEVETSFTFTPKNDGIFIPTDYQYTFSVDAVDNNIKSIGQKNFSMTVTDNTAAFVSESFNSCPGLFSERVVSGPSTWSCSGYGNPDEAQSNESNGCIEANAYGDGGATGCNTYLVLASPIDGSLYSNLYISAYVYSRYTGNGGISFVYSTNYSGSGDPEATGVTWTPLEEMNAGIPAAASMIWTNVSTLLENVPDGPIYIAIHHSGGTTASSSNWRIDDFTIKGN